MYVIGKTFSFSAAHHLPDLPVEHKCRRPHGHNYTVTVELAADRLDGHGFVLDYGALDPIGAFIRADLDHRDLNEILPGFPPTAENLAAYLFGRVERITDLVCAVRVSETPTTFAEFREGGQGR